MAIYPARKSLATYDQLLSTNGIQRGLHSLHCIHGNMREKKWVAMPWLCIVAFCTECVMWKLVLRFDASYVLGIYNEHFVNKVVCFKEKGKKKYPHSLSL